MRSRQRNQKMTGENTTEPGIFWMHITFFALYNGMLGLPENPDSHFGGFALGAAMYAIILTI